MTLRKNAVEWSVFGASVIVILATVGALVHGVVTASGTSPDLRVILGRPMATAAGFRVPVEVSNRSDMTAEQAKIEVTLVSGGKDVEKAELTIAFVPGQSQRNGWVIFRRDPRCCTTEARAVSFEAP